VDDDVDRARDAGVARDPVLGDVPVIGDIGEVFMTDDDQQVEIGLVAVGRFVDPVVACVAAEQDDLVDLAVALVRLGRLRSPCRTPRAISR